jgi:hypothetical protein
MDVIQVGVNMARSSKKRILCVSARGQLPVPVQCTRVGFRVYKKFLILDHPAKLQSR